MGKAHLFFPENDLALGRNLENYTAPGAAVKLRTSGYALPIWFMERDDCFVAQGIDSRWLEGVRGAFGVEALLYDRSPGQWKPQPWGWSRASRRFLEHLGFDRNQLPTDDALDRIRNLSHRRTAVCIAESLQPDDTPVAEEHRCVDGVEDYVARKGEAVIKLPWSSTGRGIVMLGREDFGKYRKQIAGMIANQGSVLCEPRMKCLRDFAMLFTMEGGRARYDGISVFRNAASGSYEGNMLAPQEELEAEIEGLLPSGSLERTRTVLPSILEDLIGFGYEGPLGVDMMVYEKGGATALDSCVELNLRNTMGHVALRFYRNFCSNGVRGMLRVLSERPEESAQIVRQRLCGGTMCLNPPGGAFSFVAELEPSFRH